MSNEEPVSAYSYFKAAKELSDSKKQSKKKQNGSATNKGKVKVKKVACAPGKPKTMKQKKTLSAKNNKSTKTNGKQAKQSNTKQEKSKDNFSDSGVVNLVESLYIKNPKKLTKAEEKKKKNLEDYLVKQLEMDDQGQLNESEESFNSLSSGEEDSYTESDSYSDEYTINNSGSFSELSDEKEESYNKCDEEKPPALALCQDKPNKKRKSPETETKEKCANKTQNDSKAKKSKNVNDSTASRKSLPLTSKNSKTEDTKKSRSSLASLDELSTSSKVSSTPRVKLQTLSKSGNVYKFNSIEEGKRAFEWLLNPITVESFFAQHWERKACLIKRQQNSYFAHLISFESIDQMMLTNHVEFTKNIDVTSYKKGVRETLNPEGRALPPVVWDHYGQGCSIRLINPQTFLPPLYSLCATMQEYFHCLVGANAYLTPPNSQGFAPHYDDIEAFVLQVEGRKRWRLYKPRAASETLPRYSSPNFTQSEIGKPILDEILEPGDMLYFPRGTIHQATTEPGCHSLHITLSVYQKQSFADLFEKMFPIMLQKAISTNLDMRRGLPLHAWQHAGVAYSNHSSKERADLIEKVTQLMHKCISETSMKDIMDAGFDQLAKRFQHEALPPQILPAEKTRTVFGSRSRTNERGECVCDYDIDERTNVRLLRANILHLVEEEGKIRIYYYLENSKEYCQYEPNFIEIEPQEAASVEVLIKSYPQYVGVSQLPLPSDDLKINLATALWERGLLMMEKPFR